MDLPRRLPAMILLLGAGVTAAFGQAPRNARAIEEVASGRQKVARASWWGYDPADATAALQAAIDSGAEKVVVENLGTPWIVDKIRLASNQEVFFEKGVVVVAKRGAFKGKGDSLFTAAVAENVTLTGDGATLKMWREDYDSDAYEKAEWRHVLSIRSCTNVRIAGLTLAESGGDGIYLGVAQKGVTNSNVRIENVVCENNYRQGISVISAENLTIENCLLRGTGGTAPMAGIDFEPNHASEKLVNCVMRNCVAEDNQGDGYLFYLKNLNQQSEPISIRLENCRSIGNRSGLRFIMGNGADRPAVAGRVEFVDCRFTGGKMGGISIGEKPAAVCPMRLVRCEVSDAAPDRPTISPIMISSGPDNVDDVGGIEFVDCTIRDAVDRPPINYTGLSLGPRIVGVTGTLAVERDGRRTEYELTQELIDRWMPLQAFKRIAPYDARNAAYEPVVPDAAPASFSSGRFRQRGRAAYLVWAKAGEQVAFAVRVRPVGRAAVRPASVRVVSPSGSERRLPDTGKEGEGSYTFEADETGAYRVECDAGNHTTQLSSATHRACEYAPRGPFHFLGTAGELFFWVPPGVQEWAVTMSGGNASERVKAGLYNPAGELVEEEDSILGHQFAMTRERAPAGEIWSLRLDRPSEGVLEDYYVQLQGLPPVLASSRETLLRPVK